MRNRFISLSVLVMVYCYSFATSYTVHMKSSGTLIEQIGIDNIDNVTELTIFGDLNGTDIFFIQKLDNLIFLDLRKANIVDGGNTADDNFKSSKDEIGVLFFLNKKLESLYLPQSLKIINKQAYIECKNLKTLYIPSSVKEMWPYLPKTLESLIIDDEEAFCKIKRNYYSATMSALPTPSYRLYKNGSEIQDLKVPDGISEIYDISFCGCSGICSLTLPQSITKIGDNAFHGCRNIKKVYSQNSTPPVIGGTFNKPAFDDVQGNATLYVPKGCKQIYWLHPYWGKFADIVEIDSNPKDEPTEKCSPPRISYKNGKIIFSTDTEGATFISNISDSDIRTHNSSEIDLTVTYTIEVYAAANGYFNSDKVIATLCWIDYEPKTEGLSNGMAQVSARAVMVKTDAGQLIVEGAEDNTNIVVYSIDGVQVGSTTSRNGVASVNTTLSKDSVAIVRIGNKSLKVIMR